MALPLQLSLRSSSTEFPDSYQGIAIAPHEVLHSGRTLRLIEKQDGGARWLYLQSVRGEMLSVGFGSFGPVEDFLCAALFPHQSCGDARSRGRLPVAFCTRLIAVGSASYGDLDVALGDMALGRALIHLDYRFGSLFPKALLNMSLQELLKLDPRVLCVCTYAGMMLVKQAFEAIPGASVTVDLDVRSTSDGYGKTLADMRPALAMIVAQERQQPMLGHIPKRCRDLLLCTEAMKANQENWMHVPDAVRLQMR